MPRALDVFCVPPRPVLDVCLAYFSFCLQNIAFVQCTYNASDFHVLLACAEYPGESEVTFGAGNGHPGSPATVSSGLWTQGK